MLKVNAQQEGREQSEEEDAKGDKFGIDTQESVAKGDSERVGNHYKDDCAIKEVQRCVVGPRA